MSFPSNTALPIPLLLHYRSVRQRSQSTPHERNVALLDAARILHLQPVPESFLARSSLTPSTPPPLVQFSSAAHQQLLDSPRHFDAAARLTVTEFTLLHAHVHQDLLGPRTHPKLRALHVHSMPTELTSSDQLLLFLLHLSGTPVPQLAIDFNLLHPTTLYRIIDHVAFCFNNGLSDMISWPSSEERQLLHGRMSVCTGAVAVLDGTHCPIQAPKHLNNLYYSGYKCKHTQNYLVCVNYIGMILYIDGPYVGRHNDRRDYKQSELFTDIRQYVDTDEYILADGGFIDGPNLLVPINQTVIDKQTDPEGKRGMEAYNKEFTSNRLIVEDVFGWLKQRACILNTAWPRERQRQSNIFSAACRLHNFIRMLRIDYAMQLPANDVDDSQ